MGRLSKIIEKIQTREAAIPVEQYRALEKVLTTITPEQLEDTLGIIGRIAGQKFANLRDTVGTKTLAKSFEDGFEEMAKTVSALATKNNK